MRLRLLALLLVLLSAPTVASASTVAGSGEHASDAPSAVTFTTQTHRVIVRLATPALARYAASGAVDRAAIFDDEGLLDEDSPAARSHLARISAEQEAFLAQLDKQVPEAVVDHYVDELGVQQPLRWSVVFNGMTLTAGMDADADALAAKVRALPGVLSAEVEGLNELHMFDSLGVVKAIDAWNDELVGGMENAGLGIRFASADCGAHKDAPMFDGAGFDYPDGYPLGDVSNTNGKIIASRSYFRSYDPPARGEENPWPGPASIGHGVHTIGTAAGNQVEVQPLNNPTYPKETIAGVAPGAYIMSYRICYQGVYVSGRSIGDAEAIAAHEDLVLDDAQVVNNSWGGGAASIGGVADLTEVALENAWHAGVFVAVSNGNAGPRAATMDHPSPLYVNVGNTTKGSRYGQTGLSVIAPEGVPPILSGIPFTLAGFGAAFDQPKYGPYFYKTAASVDETNFEGCNPYPEGTFDGQAAVISRGTCSFHQKVWNAENAGAILAVVHNDEARGEELITMSADPPISATIHAMFVPFSAGSAMTDWYAAHPGEAELLLDSASAKLTFASNPGAVVAPDTVNAGSSRGPAAGNVLKPDLAAPGTDILSQGFGPGPGAAAHLQFGTATGTSMSAPHVAGAAAVLRAVYPEWTIDQIKSALMATAQYMDIMLPDGSAAQPLDIGAGRLDVAAALDPGAIASPPSLSFGQVVEGVTAQMTFELHNVSDAAATYTTGSIDTRPGFAATTDLAGVTVSPAEVELAPGGKATVTVEWDTTAAGGYGDQQGYITLDSDEHNVHLPAWMRVAYPPTGKQVLLIDNDGALDDNEANLSDWYEQTLDSAFISYDVWDVDDQIVSGAPLLPRPEHLSAYDWILFQSGTHNVQLPGIYTQQLNEYMNAGGRMAIFGQNSHAIFGEGTDQSLFWDVTLAASPAMIHSITGEEVVTTTLLPLIAPPNSPLAGLNMRFDVSGTGDGAGNQSIIHEVDFDSNAIPLLMHTLTSKTYDGYVAAARKESASLEVPGVTYPGRSMLFNLGLEGINDDIPNHSKREDLMFAMDAWLTNEAEVSVGVDAAPANAVTYFTMTVGSDAGRPTMARIDYGDGSPIGEFNAVITGQPYNALGFHVYRQPGTYTVRVQGVDSFGEVAFAELDVDIEVGEDYVPSLPQGGRLTLPWLAQNAILGEVEGP